MNENELATAVSAFSQTRQPGECIGLHLYYMALYPRIHFFTLSSAMGERLADGEILVPAVSIGPVAGRLRDGWLNLGLSGWAAKFQQGHFGVGGRPIEQVIEGAPGFAGASFIMPHVLVGKIFGRQAEEETEDEVERRLSILTSYPDTDKEKAREEEESRREDCYYVAKDCKEVAAPMAEEDEEDWDPDDEDDES